MAAPAPSYDLSQRPKIGVAAIITNREGKILIGKRKSSHGAGTWQLPGGHLEYQEKIFRCAEREAEEETGLVVKGSTIAAVTNDVFAEDGKHYVTLFVHCGMADDDAKPRVKEPQKCESWIWSTWEHLKTLKDTGGPDDELFLPLINLLDQTPDLAALKAPSAGLAAAKRRDATPEPERKPGQAATHFISAYEKDVDL